MATTLTTLNVSPLAFLPANQWYNHRRAYVYGNIMPLVVPLNRIPPFAISFEDHADIAGRPDLAGVNWTLINYNTGVETNIGVEINATGYGGFVNENGRVVLQYPGNVNLPGIDSVEDLYYIRFEDIYGNFIRSEIFAWQDNLENSRKYVKVEWWHGEDFVYPGGTIRYDFPFKMWCYLYTDIGKPERLQKEEVEERDGRKLYLKQISWKVFKFEFRAPEYLVDAMDLIWQHDACQVTHMGRIYEVEEFVMNTEWLEYGDFARVTVEFRSDTVVVVNGRSLEDFDYEPGLGECLTPDFVAIAWIVWGSDEWDNFTYRSSLGGTIDFNDGEYAVVENFNGTGFDVLRQHLSSSWISVTMNDGETVHVIVDNRVTPAVILDDYLYRSSGAPLYQVPVVSNESNVSEIYTIDGLTFNNSLIEVWLMTDDGDVLAGTFFSEDFTGDGISFDSTGANAYFVRARTYVCSNLGESEATLLEGIGFDEIGDTHIVYPDPGAPTPDEDDLDG